MMEKKFTVLLTGATGFLGSHLLEALLNLNYRLVVAKRSTSNSWRIKHLLSRVTSYNIDEQPLEVMFKNHKIDVIVHLATLYKKSDDDTTVSQMIKSNVSFPAELIEIGSQFNIKAFINSGTFFEYDCRKQPVDESAAIKPFNLYSKSKVAFEAILKTYSDAMIINTLRLFSPFGAKDNCKIIPKIIKGALNNEKVELSDGLQKLDFIYTSDIVSAYIKALERVATTECKNEYEVFNIGSGAPLSVRDVLSIIEQHTGVVIEKSWGRASKNEIPVAYADISKAERLLRWSPKEDIHEGIKKTILYYEEEANANSAD